jgi:hypothetical protein
MHIHSLLKTLCSKKFIENNENFFAPDFCLLPTVGKGRGKKYILILKLIASPKKLSSRRP